MCNQKHKHGGAENIAEVNWNKQRSLLLSTFPSHSCLHLQHITFKRVWCLKAACVCCKTIQDVCVQLMEKYRLLAWCKTTCAAGAGQFSSFIIRVDRNIRGQQLSNLCAVNNSINEIMSKCEQPMFLFLCGSLQSYDVTAASAGAFQRVFRGRWFSGLRLCRGVKPPIFPL